MHVTVWVPKVIALDGPALQVVRGSGIVSAEQDPTGPFLVDYEGNIYGASNIINFADRCYLAAGRHLERYPTIARTVVNRSDMDMIGTFDGWRVEVGGPAMAQVLRNWLETVDLNEDELVVTARRDRPS